MLFNTRGYYQLFNTMRTKRVQDRQRENLRRINHAGMTSFCCESIGHGAVISGTLISLKRDPALMPGR